MRVEAPEIYLLPVYLPHLSPDTALEAVEYVLRPRGLGLDRYTPGTIEAARELYFSVPEDRRRAFRSRILAAMQAPSVEVDDAVRVFGDDLDPSEFVSLARRLIFWNRAVANASTEQRRASYLATERSLRRLVAATGPDAAPCELLTSELEHDDNVVPYPDGLIDCAVKFPRDEAIAEWTLSALEHHRLRPWAVSILFGGQVTLGPPDRPALVSLATARVREVARLRLPPEQARWAMAVDGELGCPDGPRETSFSAEDWLRALPAGLDLTTAPGCPSWRLAPDPWRRLVPTASSARVGALPACHMAALLPVLGGASAAELVLAEGNNEAGRPAHLPVSLRETARWARFCEASGGETRQAIHRALATTAADDRAMSETELNYALCAASALTDAEVESFVPRLVRTIASMFQGGSLIVRNRYWRMQLTRWVEALPPTSLARANSVLVSLLHAPDAAVRAGAVESLYVVATVAPQGRGRSDAVEGLRRHAREGRDDSLLALLALRLAGAPEAAELLGELARQGGLTTMIVRWMSQGVQRTVPASAHDIGALLDAVPNELKPQVVRELVHHMETEAGAAYQCAHLGPLVDAATARDVVRGLSLPGCPHTARGLVARRVASATGAAGHDDVVVSARRSRRRAPAWSRVPLSSWGNGRVAEDDFREALADAVEEDTQEDDAQERAEVSWWGLLARLEARRSQSPRP